MATTNESKIAERDLFFTKDGKITDDNKESASLFVAKGTELRADHVARMDAEGYSFPTKTAKPAEETKTDEDAETDQKALKGPPSTKALKTTGTK